MSMRLLGHVFFSFIYFALALGMDEQQYLYLDGESASVVTEHTPEHNFESSNAPRLVEFYSPFCGGCRNFKPKYVELAKDLTLKYSEIEVYAVSCAPHKSLCNKHKISGYPSLYAFPEGSTEGIYLQRSSMGGSYSISSIAKALNLKKGGNISGSTQRSKVDRKLTADDREDSLETKETNEVQKQENENKSSSKKTSKESSSSTTPKDSNKVNLDKDANNDAEAVDADGEEDTNETDNKENEEEKDESENSENQDERKDKEETKIAENEETTDTETKKEDQKEDSENDEEGESEKKSGGEQKNPESKVKAADKKENVVEGDTSDKKETESENNHQKDDAATNDEEDGEDKKDAADQKENVEEGDTSDKKETESENKHQKDDAATNDEEDGEDKKDGDEEKDDENQKEEEGENNEGKEADTDDEEKEKEDEADHNAALAPRKDTGSKSHKVFTGFTGGKRNQAAGAGALKASKKSRYMDKYQDIIEKKRKKLDVSRSKKSMSFLRPLFIKNGRKYFGPGSKVTLNSPGKSGDTKVMLKNKPGTPEFEARKREIMERISRSKSGRKFLPFMMRRSKLDPNAKLINKMKLPFKKEPVKPGFFRRSFERIPMVKNVFHMSPEEELILDATLSLIAGLKHGVYSDDNPLSSKKKEALRTWLNLLSIGLPPEWGLHVLIDSLTNQINVISNSHQSLLNVLEKYPLPRKSWSQSCDKRGTGGFSCGMWKLLHIVTVGVAQHRGGQNLIDSGLMDATTYTFSPYDAAEAIRDYMDNFYSCDECRSHFLKQYEDCEFRRCERLTSNESSDSADDWKQLSLWLWEVHNDVNVRVANKRLEQLQKKLSTQHLQGAQHLKIVHKREDEIRSIWPSLEDCLPCFDDSGKWNEDSVFEFLERTYWDAPDAKFDRLLTKRVLDGEDVSGGGLVWTMMIMAVFVVLFVRSHVSNVAVQNERKRINIPSSVLGMKNKISDVVAGKHRTA